MKSPHAWHPPKKNTKSSTTWKWFSGGMAIFAFLVSLMTIFPRMSITISGPADNREPLSSSFLIANDGALPVLSVSPTCLVEHVEIGGVTIQTESHQLTPVLGASMPHPRTLYPGEKESVPFTNCIMTQGINIKTAHVGLRVTYRPWTYFPTRTIDQEFYARSVGLGRYDWYSNPGG